MMRVLSIAGLCLLSFSAVAQTREETEAWILTQAEVNPPLLKYTFEAGEFVSEVSMGAGANSFGATPVRKAIPLAKVTRITYLRTNRFLSYSLMCDEPCSYLLDEPDARQPKFLFEIYQQADASYPPRMNKALLRLISLHGGQATITEEPASKEAY
jgi:hypothetical protein